MLSASTTFEINLGRAQLWSSALRTSANCGRELNHSWIQLNFSSVVERSTLVKKARKLLIQWDVRRACLAHTIGSKTESCFLYGWVRKKRETGGISVSPKLCHRDGNQPRWANETQEQHRPTIRLANKLLRLEVKATSISRGHACSVIRSATTNSNLVGKPTSFARVYTSSNSSGM